MSVGRSDKTFSRQGFRELPNLDMANPNDVTIDIPLHPVTSHGHSGARKVSDPTSPSRFGPPVPQYGDHSIEKKADSSPRVAGRRRVHGHGKSSDSDDGEGEVLNRMGRLYTAIINFSVVTRYFIYVLPVAVAISIPIVIGATVATSATVGGVPLHWFFTWIEVIWLSVWVSKLVAKLLPFVFQFLVGIVSSGTRKYALILKALEIPLSLVGWAVTSLSTFMPLMQQNPEVKAEKAKLVSKGESYSTPHWESILQKILAATLIAALIFLGEKFFIQVMSISYHHKQFNAKIKESKRNVHLLGLLFDASAKLFPPYCKEFAEEDFTINDTINLGSKSKNGHTRSASVAPLRLLHSVGRVGDKFTAAFGQVAKEITGKQVFDPTSAHSVVIEALERNASAEALARRIWMSFVIEGKDALYQEDIIDVLGIEYRSEAEECFNILDRDGNGDISLDEMVMAVCEFARDRRSVSVGLRDVEQAIYSLDNLLCTCIFVVVIFVFVAFLNSSFTTTLATAGTTLLSLSFVFSVTAQEVLGSCIFLFVKHPFDVGDRVAINDTQFVVEHISLLFTVFRKITDHRTTQIPNNVLNSQWIDNISRSSAMQEELLIYISFDTTLEDINLIKEEMQKFVSDKDNSRDFRPEVEVEVSGISEMDKMELKIVVRHKSNWANETIRAARRSKFMCALVLVLRKIPIYAPGGGYAALGDPGNPSYSVNVSDLDATAARAEWKEAQEAKRMVNNSNKNNKQNDKKQDDSKAKASGSAYASESTKPSLRNRTGSGPASEMAALEVLNARAPGQDLGRDSLRTFPNTRAFRTNSTSSSTLGEERRRSDAEDSSLLLRRECSKGYRKPRLVTIPSHTQSQRKVPTIRTTVEPAVAPMASLAFAQAQLSQQQPPPPQQQEVAQPQQEQQQDSTVSSLSPEITSRRANHVSFYEYEPTFSPSSEEVDRLVPLSQSDNLYLNNSSFVSSQGDGTSTFPPQASEEARPTNQGDATGNAGTGNSTFVEQ